MASRTVRKRTDAEVHTWAFGEDAPDGFDIVTGSDGRRTAVKRDGSNIARNHLEEAVSIPEGGALIVHADGTHTYVNAREEIVPYVDEASGERRERRELRDNHEGINRALKSHGYETLSDDQDDQEQEDDQE